MPRPLSDEDLIAEIDEHDQDCNDWESRFVADVQKQLSSGKPLTQKQRGTAESLLDKLDARKDGDDD